MSENKDEDLSSWDTPLLGRTVFNEKSIIRGGECTKYHTATIRGLGNFCCLQYPGDDLKWSHEETMDELEILKDIKITRELERQCRFNLRLGFLNELEGS